MRRLLRWLLPGGAVVAGAAWWAYQAPRTIPLGQLPLGYLLALHAAVAVLAWRFRRTRLVFSALALGITQGWLSGVSRGEPAPPLAGLVLPIELAFFSLLPERRLLSWWSLAPGGLLAVHTAVAARLLPGEPPSWAAGDVGAAPWLAWSPLPQPSLTAFAVAAAVMFVAATWRRTAADRAAVWALPATFLACAAAAPSIERLYLAAASTVLALGVLEGSFAMAYRDRLTGLPSRRAFDEELPRLRGRFALAMVDVDHFKRINDRHGHLVGDQVLRFVARHLAGVGSGGRAFRYGGEEFALLFPGRDAGEARTAVDAVRAEIAATSFTVRAAGRPRRKPRKGRRSSPGRTTLRITVSAGVAGPGARAPHPEAVLAQADRALYRAKRGGRNRVR